MDVIIIDDTSSSGKSSIAKELQSILPRNYLQVGIDTFISIMPEKSNSLDHSNKIVDGFYFQKPLHECLHRLISALRGAQNTHVLRVNSTFPLRAP